MSPFPRPELFWSTEQVAAKLGDPKVRIVDCRYSTDRDMRDEYRKAHLPGAVYLNWATDISAPPPPSGHPQFMLQGPAEFAAAMSRLGIGDDTFVVGYDVEGGHHAARLWLGLRLCGLEDKRVRDLVVEPERDRCGRRARAMDQKLQPPGLDRVEA